MTVHKRYCVVSSPLNIEGASSFSKELTWTMSAGEGAQFGDISFDTIPDTLKICAASIPILTCLWNAWKRIEIINVFSKWELEQCWRSWRKTWWIIEKKTSLLAESTSPVKWKKNFLSSKSYLCRLHKTRRTVDTQQPSSPKLFCNPQSSPSQDTQASCLCMGLKRVKRVQLCLCLRITSSELYHRKALWKCHRCFKRKKGNA